MSFLSLTALSISLNILHSVLCALHPSSFYGKGKKEGKTYREKSPKTGTDSILIEVACSKQTSVLYFPSLAHQWILQRLWPSHPRHITLVLCGNKYSSTEYQGNLFDLFCNCYQFLIGFSYWDILISPDIHKPFSKQVMVQEAIVGLRYLSLSLLFWRRDEGPYGSSCLLFMAYSGSLAYHSIVEGNLKLTASAEGTLFMSSFLSKHTHSGSSGL